MICDERIFEAGVVPERDLVVHRRDELEQLASQCRATGPQGPSPVTYLLGPTGTGKTMTAELVLKRLQEHAHIDATAHLNCWELSSRHDVIHAALSELQAPVPRNTATSDLLQRLRDHDPNHRVVILDEVDQLAGIDVLYDFYETSRLALVLVANSEEQLWIGVDDRVTSRVAVGRRIMFDPYSTTELAEILSKRAEHGLHSYQEPPVTDQQLESIAREAAGNARAAIRMLREAAVLASDAGRTQISSDDIQRAVGVALDALQGDALDRLDDHQRAVYRALGRFETAQIGAVYDVYQQDVEDPMTKKTVQRYLKKMHAYDLVDYDREKGGRHYWRTGPPLDDEPATAGLDTSDTSRSR